MLVTSLITFNFFWKFVINIFVNYIVINILLFI
jgi:hypothetical protein